MSRKQFPPIKNDHLRPGQSGQGLVEYALILILVAAAAMAGLAATGSSVSDVYAQIIDAVNGKTEENPGHIVVSVVDGAGKGIANVRVYLFNDKKQYRGQYGNTDSQGNLIFEEVPDGRYQFRADYQTRQFWSDPISWPNEWHAVVATGQRPFTVHVVDNNGSGLNNVRVYAFNEKGNYTGIYGNTAENGQLVLNLADGALKFRANYQTRQYWSDVVTSPEDSQATVNTGQRPFTVHVVDNDGGGINNVRVYAFNEAGNYTGVYGNTDSDGQLVLNLADGALKFRADYQTRQYWSDVVTSPEDSQATVKTGQRPFTIHVVDNNGSGIANVRVYAFNDKGNYTGVYGNTVENGRITLNLADGSLKFRADYQTRQYWSDVVTSPDVTETIVKTGQQTFTVNVIDNDGAGIANVRVYAFNESGSYTGVYGNTDANGQLALELADGSLKFRADYQTRQYWSDVVTAPGNSTATVETGQRPFTITVIDQNNNKMANVRVYAFNENGNYTGTNDRSDANGLLTLNLADGDLKFRADYGGQSYWSAVVISPDTTTASVTIQN